MTLYEKCDFNKMTNFLKFVDFDSQLPLQNRMHVFLEFAKDVATGG